MSAPSTKFKRLFLRWLFWNKGTGTLEAALMAAASSSMTVTSTGLVMTMTSGNGHSAAYTMPPGYSALDAAELVADLVERFYEAQDALGGTPTDEAYLAEILDKMTPVQRVHTDFAALRSGPPEEE